jgi:hypothetical protein
MKHTPGPWEVDLGGMDAKVICPDGRFFMVGDIVYHEENKDNARLISAAPDLLVAANVLIDRLEKMGYTDFHVEEISVLQSAIAKAEGWEYRRE